MSKSLDLSGPKFQIYKQILLYENGSKFEIYVKILGF